MRDVPLAARATPTAPERPLSLEISDDGTLVADDYEYCVPGTTLGVPDTCAALARGTWLGSTTGAGGDAPDIPGARQPTFFGSRLVVSDGQRILTQPAPGGLGALSAAPWIAPAAGLGYRRADVPPTGGKVAVEVFNGAVEAKNAIAVIPYSGDIGTGSADSSQGCTMGAPDVSGNAFAVAWSPDGAQIAWRDDAGLKVAGAPVLPWPSQAPCSLTAPPALITTKPAKAEEDLKDSGYRTTVGPSFGGADVAAVRAARAKTRGVGLLDPYKPIIALPRATRAKALRRGLPVTVTSAAAVPITVTARVGAGLADRLGIPTILATGTAKADHAGQQVALKLRLTAKARRRLPKLAGSALTLQVVQAGRTSSRPLALG